MPIASAAPRRARPLTRLFALSVATAAAAACGREGPTEPAGCTRGQPRVTVSGGEQPTFTWEPACPIAFLTVEGGGDYWSVGEIFGAGGDLIAPPVRYTGPPLVRGQRYTVRLEAMAAASTAACGLFVPCVPGEVATVDFTP